MEQIVLNPFPLYSVDSYDAILDRTRNHYDTANFYYDNTNIDSAWNKNKPKTSQTDYEEDNFITYNNQNNKTSYNRNNRPNIQVLGTDVILGYESESSFNNYGSAFIEPGNNPYARLNQKLKKNRKIPKVSIFNPFTKHYMPNPDYWIPNFPQ